MSFASSLSWHPAGRAWASWNYHVPLEEITAHYAETLAYWRNRFRANLGRIRGLGFSEEFLRTWEFYFCYCEGGFRERVISDVQILLDKPRFS